MREGSAGAAYTPTDDVEELDLDAPAAPPSVVSISAEVHIKEGMPGEPVVLSASIERSDVESAEDEDTGAGAAAAAVVHSGLDIQQVTRQWEMVKKACRTRSQKLAALLNDAHPVAVGGEDGCEIAIQVEFEWHYKKLLEPASRSIIEWGLKEILDQPCRARFLHKDDPIPASTLPPQAAPVDSSPAGPAQTREQRPAPAATQASVPPSPQAREGFSDDTPRSPRSMIGAAPAAEQADAAPATQNGHSAPPAVDKKPKNLLEEKIKRDPVVEEIIKTYGAELVDWKPIEE